MLSNNQFHVVVIDYAIFVYKLGNLFNSPRLSCSCRYLVWCYGEI